MGNQNLEHVKVMVDYYNQMYQLYVSTACSVVSEFNQVLKMYDQEVLQKMKNLLVGGAK